MLFEHEVEHTPPTCFKIELVETIDKKKKKSTNDFPRTQEKKTKNKHTAAQTCSNSLRKYIGTFEKDDWHAALKIQSDKFYRQI